LDKSQRIHIGTSGWHYEHWRGPFYPAAMPPRNFLGFYAKHFETAEINSTFYGLPDRDVLTTWTELVPSDFVFAVKGSRYITHMKKLKEPERTTGKFLERIEALGDKKGPILFQLPPKWGLDIGRLRSFLDALPKDERYAFEFRDPDWFGNETEELLAKKGAAFCIYDFDERQSPDSVTADFVYIRLHGPDGAYQGNYSEDSLSRWAKRISSWEKEGKEVFCYFDNDENGYAAQNASTLDGLLR
jgi:uncharacterized protein YecE (DUF72 family)